MLISQFQPLADRVLLERCQPEEKTAGGIIIPDSNQEKPMMGKVLAVGEGKYENGSLVPLSLKVGDMVVFSKFSTSDIKLEGKDLLIIKECDIVGKQIS